MPRDESYKDEGFTSAKLEDFEIYHDDYLRRYAGKERKAALANELAELHDLTNKDILYFDGIISSGRLRRYVQRVPFKHVAIGNYEDTALHTVGDKIWIKSVNAHGLGPSAMWYHLGEPSSQYRRYYQSFLWMANFAKHLVDFLQNHQNVSLHTFRASFYDWLQGLHGQDHAFQRWLAEYGRKDFSHVLTSRSEFLWNEAALLDIKYTTHKVWSEVHPRQLNAVPKQPSSAKLLHSVKGDHNSKEDLLKDKTLVTPYVWRNFQHLPESEFMKPMKPKNKSSSHTTLAGETDRSKCFRTDVVGISRDACITKEILDAMRETVSVGDVVQLPSDPKSISKWQNNVNEIWLAYVQGIANTEQGRELSIIWLYHPSDTLCDGGLYPHKNELFFSDHCECGKSQYFVENVLGKTSVAFFGGPEESLAEYFVRSKYVGGHFAQFSTLSDRDLSCDCWQKVPDQIWETGDTVLITRSLSPKEESLEPAEILEYGACGSKGLVSVRHLRRRGRDYGHADAEPNEVVYTDHYEAIPKENIHRRCHVRFYTLRERDQQDIPAPYSCKGTGDAFYIMFKETQSNQRLEPLVIPYPSSLKQGFDPQILPRKQKLRGMDVFCGCGNFGRGLEDSGCVEMKWAIDIDNQAIHSYSANMRKPNAAKLFNGSINEFMLQAMQGKGGTLVPRLGEVQLISAGSPCPGFSLLNAHITSPKALRDRSLLASVASLTDYYRPEYVLLENVPQAMKNSMFRQFICATVGMGYQISLFTVDAWSHGSPQSRTRLLVSITAPGLTPLREPPQSHAHLATTLNLRLGETPNGEAFGVRGWTTTSFPYITVGTALADLPYNHDGRVQCIPFPDHEPARDENAQALLLISNIPRFPRGLSPGKARALAQKKPMSIINIPQNVIDSNPIFWSSHYAGSSSRSYQRMNPNALAPTVTTKAMPQCKNTGFIVHWDALRCLTVMEARRIQGIPDYELLIGSPRQKWQQIGNAVDRRVALSVGMSLRAAWLANDATQIVPARVLNYRPRSSKLSMNPEAIRIGGISGDEIAVNARTSHRDGKSLRTRSRSVSSTSSNDVFDRSTRPASVVRSQTRDWPSHMAPGQGPKVSHYAISESSDSDRALNGTALSSTKPAISQVSATFERSMPAASVTATNCNVATTRKVAQSETRTTITGLGTIISSRENVSLKATSRRPSCRSRHGRNTISDSYTTIPVPQPRHANHATGTSLDAAIEID